MTLFFIAGNDAEVLQDSNRKWYLFVIKRYLEKKKQAEDNRNSLLLPLQKRTRFCHACNGLLHKLIPTLLSLSILHFGMIYLRATILYGFLAVLIHESRWRTAGPSLSVNLQLGFSNLEFGIPFASWRDFGVEWCDFGVECKNTSKDQSTHDQHNIIVLKASIPELHMHWNWTVGINMKAKNSLFRCEGQLGHVVKN